jgi:hypothetical protein
VTVQAATIRICSSISVLILSAVLGAVPHDARTILWAAQIAAQGSVVFHGSSFQGHQRVVLGAVPYQLDGGVLLDAAMRAGPKAWALVMQRLK